MGLFANKKSVTTSQDEAAKAAEKAAVEAKEAEEKAKVAAAAKAEAAEAKAAAAAAVAVDSSPPKTGFKAKSRANPLMGGGTATSPTVAKKSTDLLGAISECARDAREKKLTATPETLRALSKRLADLAQRAEREADTLEENLLAQKQRGEAAEVASAQAAANKLTFAMANAPAVE